MDHPHVHCIVPAGGLSRDGKRWLSCKNSFLFPFDVVRILFRAKILDYFKQGLEDGSIKLCGNIEEYADAAKFKTLLNKMYKVKWVIFSEQTFASPLRVIEYLGNYTHRVAIAESRLVDHDASSVSFMYKDYADDCKKKCMTLNSVEFIRRFLLHVLPSGFMRMRHYGFMSNSARKKALMRCADIFATLKQKRKDAKNKVRQPWNVRVKEQTGFDPLLCKKCGKAVMVLIAEIAPIPGNVLACLAVP